MGLAHTLRRLAHAPLFALITIATLGIGIGANSAIFAVINGVLLKPLPYPQPAELVDVDHSAAGVNLPHVGIAPFQYFTYRDETRTLQSIGIWRRDTVSLTGIAEPEEIRSLHVTASVLPMLGVVPRLGRVFTERDDLPGSPRTAVLTSSYWRSKFGSDPSVVGRRIILDGDAREVIGVLGDSFRFLDVNPAVVLPLRLDRSDTKLGNFSYTGLARMKPGVGVREVDADIARMIPISLTEFPPFPGYSRKMFQDARIAPAVHPLKESFVGELNGVLWVLMGTVGVVLLIACANVANLLLVRSEGRQHELAIRAALGAGTRQLARELLLESITLGVLGGLVGIGLAAVALRVLLAIAPAHLPRLDQVSLDPLTIAFTLGVSVLAGVLFGLVPIAKYAAPAVAGTLRAGGRTMSDSRDRHRARGTLVVVQVALALVLLISSGLMLRTFQALRHVDPGFARPDQLQTLRISIPDSAVPDPTDVVRMEQNIAAKLAAVPGVASVGLSSVIPMDEGGSRSDPIFAEDHPPVESQIPAIRNFKFISPGLLQTMGNHIVVGRDFSWDDVYQRRPVAMLSENMARELWRTPEAAIGKRIRESMKNPWREVIAVVSDERDDGFDKPAPSIAFFPLMLNEFEGADVFVSRYPAYMIRTSRAGSASFLAEISRAVWSVNPNLPLASVRTLGEITARSMGRTSFALVMLGVAGAMALLLGAAGIYGVISYSVSQRTREVGIRKALGAQNGDVARMFVAYGARLAAAGIVCGLVAAIVATRLMGSLLFGVTPTDPLTYVAVSGGLAAIAILASYLPAWRATLLEPTQALRTD